MYFLIREEPLGECTVSVGSMTPPPAAQQITHSQLWEQTLPKPRQPGNDTGRLFYCQCYPPTSPTAAMQDEQEVARPPLCMRLMRAALAACSKLTRVRLCLLLSPGSSMCSGAVSPFHGVGERLRTSTMYVVFFEVPR